MSSLGIAILGLGRAGKFHLKSIRETSNVDLRYAVDPNLSLAQSVAEEHHCAAVSEASIALTDPQVKAVIIATPTFSHHSLIVQSLHAGKAVLTEKPLGTTLQEIDQCYELASTKSLPLFVAFQRRFDPSFADLARGVRNKAIGQLQFIRTVSRDNPTPSIDYIKTSCGIFHDCIVHDLDMICHISREKPVEVFAMGTNFIEAIKQVGDLDTVLVSLKFASGLLATIDVSRKSVYGYDQRVEVFGSAGMIQANNRSSLTTVSSTVPQVTEPPIDFSFPTRYREAYLRELELFRDCVLASDPVPVSHQEVRANFILAEAAEKSCRTGKSISVAIQNRDLSG